MRKIELVFPSNQEALSQKKWLRLALLLWRKVLDKRSQFLDMSRKIQMA
jgi:hypothetical protein